MKKRIVVYILGWLLVFEGFFLMLPCLVGLIYQESGGCLVRYRSACLPLSWICYNKIEAERQNDVCKRGICNYRT